jgi:hypothetical protein
MRATSEHPIVEGPPAASPAASTSPAPAEAKEGRESPDAANVEIRRGLEWLFEKLKGGRP